MTEDRFAKARAVKAKLDQTRRSSILARVEDILANPRVDRELKLKLAYCQAELARERDGKGLLEQRRGELIKEATRSFHVAPVA